MARAISTRRKAGYTAAAWIVALLIFFPILYTIITSLKSEQEAIAGFDLIPSFTFESYQAVQSQNDYFKPFMNSVILAVGSTILALIIAIPAAWAMAFSPTKRTKDILMWMLSTKMMPAVAVLVPIYLIFLRTGLMDTRIGLIDHADADRPADRGLDALHLLSRDPRRDPRSGPHGRRIALGRDLARADADGGAGHRLDACCSTSSWPGTRASGRSSSPPPTPRR